MSTETNASFLPDRRVAERYGVSVRTLARWDEVPELGFPPPTYIRARKYRSVELLQRFERNRTALAGQKAVSTQPSPQAKGDS
jgi:hypothetical protein